LQAPVRLVFFTQPVFRTLKIEYQSARRDSKSSGVSA
jgi:hypothetical protein